MIFLIAAIANRYKIRHHRHAVRDLHMQKRLKGFEVTLFGDFQSL